MRDISLEIGNTCTVPGFDVRTCSTIMLGNARRILQIRVITSAPPSPVPSAYVAVKNGLMKRSSIAP